MSVQDDLNQLLLVHGREIKFSAEAIKDYKGFDAEKRKTIIALLVKQAVEKDPLLQPDGHGEPLRSPLTGFAKIKPKALGIRIVYRPRRLPNGLIRLEVIAIGPRDEQAVYTMAAKRLASFMEQMQ